MREKCAAEPTRRVAWLALTFMSQPRTLEKHSSPTHDPFSTSFPQLDPADCHSMSHLALTVVRLVALRSSDIMINRAARAAARAVAR